MSPSDLIAVQLTHIWLIGWKTYQLILLFGLKTNRNTYFKFWYSGPTWKIISIKIKKFWSRYWGIFWLFGRISWCIRTNIMENYVRNVHIFMPIKNIHFLYRFRCLLASLDLQIFIRNWKMLVVESSPL